MAGKARHLFPGNNTPEGFFSYYRYILNPKEAKKIYCLKGGPGVGKSTLMKRIGQEFQEAGEDIDYFHCSSDRNSVDGILLKKRKIAMLDGTAPHMIDPVNPGVVDTIIHLGDFWDEKELRKQKHHVIASGERLSSLFSGAYNYLRAAGAIYDNIRSIYGERIRKEEIYKLGASIINEEMSHKEISSVRGRIKKFFASAITPQGIVNEIPSLLHGFRKVYIIKTDIGMETENLFSTFAENAINRGFDVEAFYCSMNPSGKIDHVLCHDLGVAIITGNDYHNLDGGNERTWDGEEVVYIPLGQYANRGISDPLAAIFKDSREKMDSLLTQGIKCLEEAKKEHDLLESYYIPNMDFDAINSLEMEIKDEILSL
ncbi:MAG: hypothetical protein ACOX4U_07580 [Anaerovoracaceae bacterium]|jgi:hypothetical protein